jgi:hypothetical protein
LKEGYTMCDIYITPPKLKSSTYTCIWFRSFVSFKHYIARMCKEKKKKKEMVRRRIFKQ